MDEVYLLSTPMVVRSLDVNKDPFRPQENNEELLDPKILYLSAIGALMYLANTTRPNIAFSKNALKSVSPSNDIAHYHRELDAYAEATDIQTYSLDKYVSHEKGIPPRYFDAETFRTRYATLLWKHGTQKNEIGAVNDDKSSDKPVRPQFECESSDMIIIP
ncbi:hypothetical protein FXO37_32867 [Capsicum annuum]|nr:hypothetical protein FXO37_32867 [Capsicum annuum]